MVGWVTSGSAARLGGVLAGLGAAAIWSGWYVLARHGVTAGGMAPADLAALRFLVATPILMLHLRRFPFGIDKLPLALVMALGVGPAFVIVVATGFLHAPANFGGALSAVSGVVITLVGGRLLLDERLGRVQLAGIALAVAGLTLLMLASEGGSNPGYFLVAGLLWATYSVAFRRSGLSALEAVTAVAVLSAIVYLPIYFWFAGMRLWQAPARELVLQGLGQGVLTGIVALALHARAVAALGATKGALFQSLVPAFTLILAFAFLGESPTRAETLAIGVILVGVYMALARPGSAGPEAGGALMPERTSRATDIHQAPNVAPGRSQQLGRMTDDG